MKWGKWGLRPFGSCKPQHKRKSKSLGARIRKPSANYQSAAIQQLKQWFERERNHGHEVSTPLIKDFYIKFLDGSLHCARVSWHSSISRFNS